MITKNFNFKVGDIVRIIGIFGLDVTGIYMGDSIISNIISLYCSQHKDMCNPTFLTDDMHYCTFSLGAVNVIELATENEIKDLYNHLINKYKFENQNWAKHFTDSTYYEIGDWFACKCGVEFDENNGYPNFVYEFRTYAWNTLCTDVGLKEARTDYIKPDMVNKREFIDKIKKWLELETDWNMEYIEDGRNPNYEKIDELISHLNE